MQPAVGERGDAPVWDVAVPARPRRVTGVTMAGFGDLGPNPADLRLIPHPAVMLAVMFGDGPVTVVDAAGRLQRGSLAAGLGFGPVRVRLAENFQCLQVRLSPVIAHAVLGVSPADLNGTMVALDDLWGREASRIAEELAGASSWEDRFELVGALLARRREAGPPGDPGVVWAWNQIVASCGRVRIEALADELGWSRKRLWSRFHADSGLPPKRAAKLVRFDRAAHRLLTGQDVARVAADGGYVDQSHLHRDVMAFTGVTPAALPGELFLAVDPVAWPGPGTRPLASAAGA